jgi:limonene-1,2-epoxide hydrolase
MSSPAVARTNMQERRQGTGALFRRKAKIAVVVAATLICLAILLWSRSWPFAHGPVMQDLADASDSIVTSRSFRRTYFPFPGCVIEGLIFRHGSTANAPLITIDKLIVRGSYFGILTHHVSRITAEGTRVMIPPFGSGESFQTQHSKIVVDEVIADGAVVEFATRNQQKGPLRFDVREARLRNVGWSGPLHYRLKLHNPEPPGELTVSGEFGLWKREDPGETPISGEYTFEHADLGIYGGIGGLLASQGKFGGVLKHIEVGGATDTPDFEVRSSGHRVQLTTDFSAFVDATHGYTFLKSVDAHFGRTRVIAQGSIAAVRGHKRKAALLDLTAPRGRIEDILGLFVKEHRVPMSGPVSFRAKAEIPPAHEAFLNKVKLEGVFGIEEGTFTKPETQNDVNKLSAGARGEDKDDPETVLSDLRGQVKLEGGVARFSKLSFGVPGAQAHLQGTYNIISHRINLHGTMRVDSKISKTTSGIKALLLKVMDPFLKKKKKGEVVAVHILGTYEHPEFGLDLTGQKDTNAKQK